MKSNSTKKNWYDVRIPVSETSEEAILNFLFELGSEGCQQINGEVVAYFSEITKESAAEQINSYLKELKELGVLNEITTCEINDVMEEDWNAEWKKYFKPIVVSKQFMVKPTWERLEIPVNKFVIEIDPKQAFGTGSHETTQLILQLLEDNFISGNRVLDVGTGTGILAIAATKLGAEEVVAFDNDPVAIEAAEENVNRNLGITNLRLQVADPDTIELRRTGFDVVLANITKNIIFKYFENFDGFLASDGFLILSGILVEQLEEVKQKVKQDNLFCIAELRTQKEWAALLLRKQTTAERQ